MISGYMGKPDGFDKVHRRFRETYTDQNQCEDAKLAAAVKVGRIEALIE